MALSHRLLFARDGLSPWREHRRLGEVCFIKCYLGPPDKKVGAAAELGPPAEEGF